MISLRTSLFHIELLTKNRDFLCSINTTYRTVSSCLLSKKRVALIGSGNWGSAFACHIGENVRKSESCLFHEQIRMWCKEEILDDGSKLSEVINRKHENIKYLPNRKIPHNIVATPDLQQTVENADLIIFAIPHQFVKNICEQLRSKMKPDAFALTLIKGFYVDDKTNELQLVSHLIEDILSIPCASLMGANIASEVAERVFCEATVGSRNDKHSELISRLVDTSTFRLRFYPDVEIIELLGALKNIVSLLAGFAEGLDTGFNTRATILRLGFREMINFCRLYKKESTSELFLESCGIADLIASSLGGRNYVGAKKMTATNKPLYDIERDDLNGQSLQGPGTAKEVYRYLQSKRLLDRFPLFRDVHLICEQKMNTRTVLENLHKHPEFQNSTRKRS